MTAQAKVSLATAFGLMTLVFISIAIVDIQIALVVLISGLVTLTSVGWLKSERTKFRLPSLSLSASRKYQVLGILGLVVGVTAIVVFILMLLGPTSGQIAFRYEVTVGINDLRSGDFETDVKNTFEFIPGPIEQAECQEATDARIERAGLLLQEVTIPVIKESCHSVHIDVVLEDFPRGLFFSGRNARGLEISPYLNTETISWQQSNTHSIRFAYIPSGLRFLRPLILLVYGVGNLGTAGTVVAGGGISAFAGVVSQPLARRFMSSELAKKWKLVETNATIVNVNVGGDIGGNLTVAGRDINATRDTDADNT